MPDTLTSAFAAVAGGRQQPFGWFRYDVVADTWTWSEDLFRMHGFDPGEIVPTTEIFMSHKHPEDRSKTERTLSEVCLTGEPFCCRHRLITADQQVRTIVSIGEGTVDPTGVVTEVRGYFVDVTDANREQLREAVERSAETRSVIEQAKGALMIVQGISADDAFAVLRWHSSHANVKLHVVACAITTGMQLPLAPDETPTQRISRLLAAYVR